METDERKERDDLRRSLEILHALEVLGVVEQILTDECEIIWKAKGSEKRFDAVMKALRL